MNMEEQLQAVVDQATAAADLWYKIVHGNNTAEIATENGLVPSIAKQLKDTRDAIMGGVIDVVSRAENARDASIAAKELADVTKSQIQTIYETISQFRNETETYKNQAQTTFNNIVPAINAAVLTVENAGNTQVLRVQDAVAEQVSIVQQECQTVLNSLNSKAALDLANVTAANVNNKLFETIFSGNNWYVRNKVTGFTEQGGITSAAQTGTITFQKAFATKVFNVHLTQHYNSTTRADKWSPQILGVPTLKDFKYGWGAGYVAGSYVHWRAVGY